MLIRKKSPSNDNKISMENITYRLNAVVSTDMAQRSEHIASVTKNARNIMNDNSFLLVFIARVS